MKTEACHLGSLTNVKQVMGGCKYLALKKYIIGQNDVKILHYKITEYPSLIGISMPYRHEDAI